MDKDNIIQLTNKLYRLTLLFPKKEPLRYKMREIADDVLANLVVWEVFQASNPNKFIGMEKREKELIFAIEKDLEVLNSYFEVAKWQTWVSFFDILEIEEEYDKIKRKVEEKAERFEDKIPEKISKQIGTSSVNTIEKRTEKEKEENSHFKVDQITDKTEESLDSRPLALRVVLRKSVRTELGSERKAKILEILKEKGKVQVGEISEILPNVSKRTIRRDFVQLLDQGLIERIGEKNDTFYQSKKDITPKD